jgi:hypothetical protein
LDRLLALKTSDPGRFYGLDVTTRMALASYAEGRAAAAALAKREAPDE